MKTVRKSVSVLVALLVFAFLMFGGAGFASNICENRGCTPTGSTYSWDCQGCWDGWVYRNRTYEIVQTRYSCPDGGTCRVTEEYYAPCGLCHYL
jgi:hypothetical protein